MTLTAFGKILYELLPHQTRLVMKLTAILLFAASLQLSARTFSQTVTLDVKATQLDKVFSAIKKQTGYVFFYDVDLLKEAKPVTLSVHHETLLTVLNQLFATQPLGFSIKDKNINVFRKKAIVTTAEAPELVPPAVHGRIINENGEP
ncbi:MAG: STN domain-containing protein, partial [Chloroflexota bacterium]